jgi:hypothetical protein
MIKLIKILKKLTDSVRFYKLDRKNQTELQPKKTRKKPIQIRKNRAKLKKPNQTKTSRFEPISVSF